MDRISSPYTNCRRQPPATRPPSSRTKAIPTSTPRARRTMSGRTLIEDDDRQNAHQKAGGNRPFGDKPPVFDVLQLWAVTDEDERQQEREHPLEDHDPSLPGKERRVWPGDLDQAGVDACPERCGQLSKIRAPRTSRQRHQPGCHPVREQSRPSTSAVSVLILVCSVPACSWRASRGLSCCRSRPRAVSIAPWVLVTVVVMCSSGSSCSKAACQAFHRCCSANHAFLRFPRVRTFSVTNLLTPARASPALLIAALSCGSRPARGPVAVCSARNCSAYSSTRALMSASCCSTRERSTPSATGSFEAGEAAGHGSRQGDELGQLRDHRRRCGCRSRGLRGQSPRRQHEREEHNSLEEALE